MHLKRLELNGFKSFAKKSEFVFDVPIIAIVGPNGSGKSNVVEAIRFVLGEQSTKSMRAKTGSDLIFKGSKQIPKMSRASATIVFDNSDRVFHLHHQNNEKINIDFDEVVITREVFADGGNVYKINGHEVRMKDVHELIASVNIGASGHHIISQGEADRYLNANIKDRRILIEEALGLKVYQYRIKESLRKLDKATSNMRESELLRRELAPHLRFLKKQVDKIEKAKHLRTELSEKYQSYFAQEDYLIKTLNHHLDEDRTNLQKEYRELDDFLHEHTDPEQAPNYPETAEILSHEQEQENLAQKITEARQELGRIEGMRDVLEKQTRTRQTSSEQSSFPLSHIKAFISSIVHDIDTLDLSSLEVLKGQLTRLKDRLSSFTETKTTVETSEPVSDDELEQLKAQYEEISARINTYEQERTEHQTQIQELQEKRAIQQAAFQASQRHYYEKIAYKKELDGRRALIETRDQGLGQRRLARDEEYREACVLLGVQEISYQQIVLEHELDVTAQTQEQSRRELERIKIRLEDIGGGGGGEVIKEYEDTVERDQFLAQEIEDLQTTITSLQGIVEELKETLNVQFESGVEKINEQFGRFFRLMFGGGQARLDLAQIKKRRKKNDDQDPSLLEELEEDEGKQESKQEYGIDIKVQLPRKKVSDLEMLSGGERSLTSIALLFALSQVNPPPFLVLDETDAALDEANSQRYGDMVEQLAKLSQLIVVTHNRETMSRAQTLFGVTLGRDDSSTMLSLRLEDATKYAK